MKITRNRLKCKLCGDIIESRHHHNFVMCGCGSCFTDGGLEYIRRGGDPNAMIDMSEYDEPVEDEEDDNDDE